MSASSRRRRVMLGLRSPDGEEGYPGNVDATVELDGEAADSLAITLSARTDAPTPINLTYHPYFNLAGDSASRRPISGCASPRRTIYPWRRARFPPARSRRRRHDLRLPRRAGGCAAAPSSRIRNSGSPAATTTAGCSTRDADCACELDLAEPRPHADDVGSGPGLQFYNGQFLSRSASDDRQRRDPRAAGLSERAERAALSRRAILRPGETYRATFEYRLDAR